MRIDRLFWGLLIVAVPLLNTCGPRTSLSTMPVAREMDPECVDNSILNLQFDVHACMGEEQAFDCEADAEHQHRQRLQSCIVTEADSSQ